MRLAVMRIADGLSCQADIASGRGADASDAGQNFVTPIGGLFACGSDIPKFPG